MMFCTKFSVLYFATDLFANSGKAEQLPSHISCNSTSVSKVAIDDVYWTGHTALALKCLSLGKPYKVVCNDDKVKNNGCFGCTRYCF